MTRSPWSLSGAATRCSSRNIIEVKTTAQQLRQAIARYRRCSNSIEPMLSKRPRGRRPRTLVAAALVRRIPHTWLRSPIINILTGPMMSAGPHHTVPLTQAQMAQQHQAQTQAAELAKRRSRKPTDKNIPDGVEDSIVNPESAQRYRDLKDIERLLDATITRKRLDVLDNTQHPTKVSRVCASGKTPISNSSPVDENSSYLDQQHRGGSSLAGKRTDFRRLRFFGCC